MAINIEGEMRDLINSSGPDGIHCYLGTATPDGKPQISIKGSVAVLDPGTLSYWERAKRSALANIAANPQVVFFYRNAEKKINWRFHGTATVHESGETWERVKAITPQMELDRDAELQGTAITVSIDSITELSGNVLQSR